MTTAKTTTPPQLFHAADTLREHLRAAREQRATIGVVPTMGALHAGHLSLVDACREECDVVVATIFVNPTQFGPGEDYTQYPRNIEADLRLLAQHGVDVVFAPETAVMYGSQHATSVEVLGPALSLEGEFRPTHFRGVATVVLKLFNIVQPDRAYFGRKDYQQSLVVRRMVADLNLPIAITVCPIIREPDGVAMSSRNAYLAPAERRRARSLSQSLKRAAEMVGEGIRASDAILATMREILQAAEMQIDYVAICDANTLAPLDRVEGPAVALVAARVGTTRLIDNEMLS